jgi:hypothetical protein
MMIDKSECFIFLNTPNSIEPFLEMDKTKSPWIYYEILLSKLINKKTPKRQKLTNENYLNFSGDEDLVIKYNLDLSNLIKIDFNNFSKIFENYQHNSMYTALDKLYKSYK